MSRAALVAAIIALLFPGPTRGTNSVESDVVGGMISGEDGRRTNAFCPVTEDEPVETAIFVDHEGERISFCCQRCRRKFLASPTSFVGKLPQFAARQTDASGIEHDHDDTENRGHDHVHDHGGESLKNARGLAGRVLRYAGRFHPVAVHFPIGLLVTALMAELAGAITRRDRYRVAARVLVSFGAPLAVLAAALGWAAGTTAGYSGELADVLARHRLIGTVVAVLATLTWIFIELHWRQRGPQTRALYLGLLSLTAVGVGLTGHLGGTLIYGLEHFTW